MKRLLYTILLIWALSAKAQQKIAYRFLELPATTESSSLGGFSHSLFTSNLSHSFHNPAQLRKEMEHQLHFGFNSLYTGVKQFYLQTAWNNPKTGWNISPSLMYLNYGSAEQTDIYGFVSGQINANDYLIQVAASRTYLENWNYGVTLKYIHSQIAHFKSSALAADFGLNYLDTTFGLQAAIVLKNIGVILKQFDPSADYILPFDVQLGISYEPKSVPVQVSLNTMRFPLIDHYRNHSDDKTFSKVMQRLIVSTQWKIEDVVGINIGYNYARRKDWSNGEQGRGLMGIAAGVSLYHPKFQLFYSYVPIQQQAWHQIGFAISTKKKSIF